jgi:VTC domain
MRYLSELSRFARVTPQLLESRQLLRRADTKFVIAPDALGALFEGLATDYAVVPAGAEIIATYENLYFDTPALRCFHDHRRGRRVRHKIRIRQYVERQLAFLEIKTRRNELRTDKSRLAVEYGVRVLDDRMYDFLRQVLPDVVVPIVSIDFRRIMLVGVATNERVTIDLDVAVDRDTNLAIGAVAIVEVKQPARSFGTPIMRALREARLRASSLSKYATAIAMTQPSRVNRLLPALRGLERRAHA